MEDHVHDIFVTFHAASWTLTLIDSIFISKHNIQHLEMYKEIVLFFLRIVLDCTAMHCTVLHYTALYYFSLHCTALHCTAVHCTALHCTALYCIAPRTCCYSCTSSGINQLDHNFFIWFWYIISFYAHNKTLTAVVFITERFSWPTSNEIAVDCGAFLLYLYINFHCTYSAWRFEMYLLGKLSFAWIKAVH